MKINKKKLYSKIVVNKLSMFKLKWVAMAVATLPYSTGIFAATVTINGGEAANLSDIYGSGGSQATTLNEIVFGGTTGNESTLVIDNNSSGPSSSVWNFTGNSENILISSGKNAVIKINDGITANFTGHTGYSVYPVTVDANASLVFDLGSNTTLKFSNSTVSQGSGIKMAGKELIFRGENGTVIFENLSSSVEGSAIGTAGSSGNISFEGNVTMRNNRSTVSGGAVRTGANVIFSGNDANIVIADNFTQNSGAGIFSDKNVEFYGNAEIYNNKAQTATAGALVVGNSLVMESNGTTGINVYNNTSNSQSAGAVLLMGSAVNTSRIYAKSSDIKFYSNRSGGAANAINMRNSNGTLNIAADAGRQVLFRDPITSLDSSGVPVSVKININTTDSTSAGATNGSVTFTAEDFTKNSTSAYSRIYADTQVFGGTFELKDNAVYGALGTNTSKFTLKEGARLLVSASRGAVNNAVNSGSILLENNSNVVSNGTGTLTLNSNNGVDVGSTATDTVILDTPNADILTLIGNFSGQGILQKNGTGTLLATAVNQFGNDGGLHLTKGTIDVQNYDQSISSLIVDENTIFSMGDVGANLTIEDRGSIAGNLRNVDSFTKNGNGTFTYSADVSVNQFHLNDGRVDIDANHTVTVGGQAFVGGGTNTILGVSAGNAPSMIADTVNFLGTSTVDISGYNPSSDTGFYTLIQTTNGINGNHRVTVGGVDIYDHVDIDTYLTGSSFVDGTGKNLVADLTLVWNNPVTLGAHGTFNITSNNSFNVGVALADRSGTLGFGWDGQSLTKKGAGTLYLDKANTYTGLTDIQEGSLIVGSSVVYNTATIVGDVDVHGGAKLGGHGQILGSVHLMNGSTISPGNSVGTITVGNITFDSGSIYEFEANQNGTADKINATATATINGGVVNVLSNGNIWSTTDVYTILTAASGVTGTYSGLTSNLAFLEGKLDYDANNVYLRLSRNSTGMGEIGGTENQVNTGNGIESLGPGNNIYDTVVSLDKSSALDAFDNLSGEIHANASSALLTNSRYVRAGINQHLLGDSPELGNNLWAHSWVHKGRIKNDGNAQRTTNKGYGFLIGYDRLIGEDSVIGIAGGYEQTTAKTGNVRQSKIDVDAYHLMLYGKNKVGAIDVRGGLGYAYLGFDSERNIRVTGLQGKNSARYHGQQVQGFVEGSHTFNLNKKSNLIPYANLSYAQVHTKNFTENGNITALKGESHSNNVGNSTIGIRGETILGDNNQYQIYADLGALSRFGDKKPEATLRFDGGEKYTVKGTNQGSFSGLIGVGTNIKLGSNMNLNIGYGGEIGNRIIDQSMKARLEWWF